VFGEWEWRKYSVQEIGGDDKGGDGREMMCCADVIGESGI